MLNNRGNHGKLETQVKNRTNGLRLKASKEFNGVSIEVMRGAVPKAYKKNVTQELVDEINELVNEPDFGEEWKGTMLSSLNLLDNNNTWSLKMYIRAVQFTSLCLLGVKQADAYVRVFPERLQNRIDNGEDKSNIGGEASRYNSSELVNRIRKQAMVPFHLVNQANKQEAFNIAMDIARHGRSEAARVNAVNTILAATEVPVENKIEMSIGLSDEAREAQNAQTSIMRDIALNQQEMLKRGYSIEEVQKISINKKEYVDASIEE